MKESTLSILFYINANIYAVMKMGSIYRYKIMQKYALTIQFDN